MMTLADEKANRKTLNAGKMKPERITYGSWSRVQGLWFMTTYDSRFTINGCPDGTVQEVQEEESVRVDGWWKMAEGWWKREDVRWRSRIRNSILYLCIKYWVFRARVDAYITSYIGIDFCKWIHSII
jgi:hypothetical protein